MPEYSRTQERGLSRAVLCIPPGDNARAAVRTMLEASGLAIVTEVERGLDALAATAEQQADVAILDLSLAGTLGLRLIELLRSVAPAIVIVALSPFDTLVPAALDAGADAALSHADLHQLPGLLGGLGLSD